MKVTNIQTNQFINIGNSTNLQFSSAVPSDVAIFVGKNGSGKSILLEQVAYSSQGGISNTLQQMRQTMNSFPNQFKHLNVKVGFDFGSHDLKFDQTNNFLNNPQLTQSSGICIYVPASRDFPAANDRRIQDMDFSYGQKLFIFDQGQENNFERTLVSLSNKEIQAKHHNLGPTREAATLDRIRSAYRILFPDIELIGTYGFQFIAKKNGSLFPISSASHGEKQALILLTALAKEPNLNDSVIIIDEPEIGLSKSIREKFISSLQALSTNLQIIVATHSKEVIESVDPTKIIPVD